MSIVIEENGDHHWLFALVHDVKYLVQIDDYQQPQRQIRKLLRPFVRVIV